MNKYALHVREKCPPPLDFKLHFHSDHESLEDAIAAIPETPENVSIVHEAQRAGLDREEYIIDKAELYQVLDITTGEIVKIVKA